MALHLGYSEKTLLDSFVKSLSEKALLNLLVENLDENFVLLVLKYKTVVQRIAERMRLSYDDIQEIEQQTFFNMYFALKDHAKDEIWSIQSLEGFLRVTAKNAALNLLKEKYRSVSFEQVSELYDEEDDMLEEVIRAEFLEYINRLPKKYGDLLKVLATYKGISYSDLAQLSGLPLGTVKSRVAKGRELLRQVIHEDLAKRKGK